MNSRMVDLEGAGSPGLHTTSGYASWRRLAAAMVILGAACYTAQWVSVALWREQRGVPLWLPGGLLFAALVILPKSIRVKCVLVAFLATACGGLPAGWNPAAALALALAFSLTAYFASAWQERNASQEQWLDFGDLMRFTCYVAIIASLSAIPAALHWDESLQPAGFAQEWVLAALSIMLGYLILTPPIMLFSKRALPAPRRRGVLEGLLVLVVVVLVLTVLWSMLPQWPELWLAVLFSPIAFLFWGGVRFGTWGACVSILALAFTFVAFGLAAPVAFQHSTASSIGFQACLLTVILVTYVIGILADQRNRLSDELKTKHEHAFALAGSLIDVQEAERSRISRELHDDINQKLASFCIAASALKRMSESEMRDGLDQLKKQMVNLSNDVRRLSHDLHPDVIRHTGLVCALRSLCLDRHSNDRTLLELDIDETLQGLTGQISLCLYRVTQESLHNAEKYAHYSKITLSLHGYGNAVDLTICDDGCGFDVNSLAAKSHLGLISMEERVRLVGGTFRIVSSPGQGTTVSARVPC